MPGYKTHLTVGLITSLAITKLTWTLFNKPSLQLLPLYIAITLIGSIFPDIDIRSKMQILFYRFCALAIAVTLITQHFHLFFLISFLAFLVSVLQHRTLTHQIWFLIGLPAFGVLYTTHCNPDYFHDAVTLYLYFVSGAVSHVVMDRTKTKIKMLRQGKRQRYK